MLALDLTCYDRIGNTLERFSPKKKLDSKRKRELEAVFLATNGPKNPGCL